MTETNIKPRGQFDPLEDEEGVPFFSKVQDKYHQSMRVTKPGGGMDALKAMFPDGGKGIDLMNFVLFSTSGISGSYCSIEDMEAMWKRGRCEDCDCPEGEPECTDFSITFLIIHPRIKNIKAGNALPRNQEEFDYLKELRQASWDVVHNIGRHTEED